MVKEILLRLLIGGTVVSVFALLGDLFKPKRFAGLFAAAPSVALVTLALTATSQGKEYAATEGRSMVAGAIAFCLYAFTVSWVMILYKLPSLLVTSLLLVLWFAVAFGLWMLWLR